MKFVKLILGLALILFCGHLINTWSLTGEKSNYVHIKIKYPNDLTSLTIKKVPESKCANQLSSNVEEGMSKCEGCTVETQECLAEVPANLTGIFENETLAFPYVSLDFKYPERHALIGLQEGDFEKFCGFFQKKHETAICVQ